MNNRPLVSVITIFLNAGNFIDESIRSLLTQTYDNWELFLVDDGSSDESTEIALKYTTLYPDKIHYLEHEKHQNKGMSASRNLGLRHVRGEYIALLDADDVWFPQKLSEQLEIMKSHPNIAMVYGKSEYWYSWTGDKEHLHRDTILDFGIKDDTIIDPPELLILYLRKNIIPPPPSVVMLRSKAVSEAGGFEDAFRGHFEDQVFFSKLMLKTPIYISTRCWQKYRQHPDSYCVINIEKRHEIQFQYLIWLEKYLLEKGLRGTAVWKIAQKRLWPYRHPLFHRLMGEISLPFMMKKVELNTRIRQRQGKSTGWIRANPNPIRLPRGSGFGDTRLTWEAQGTNEVEVRLNSPAGPLFSMSGSTHSESTGKWVSDDTTFYLQDASDKNPCAPENTLSQITIRVFNQF
jgi:glycosyltransferase involved in cell wall biosynthesis